MDCHRIKANECEYKEKEQFINGSNDVDMMAEIIQELIKVKQ